MGCSPSTLIRSSGSDATEATTAAVAVATTHEKDGSIFFCLKLKRDRLRRCSQLNGGEGSGGSGTGSGSAMINNDDLCNQALLNPLQIKNEADYEKMSSGKKDSIVTVAALGNFTHTVVKRATGSEAPDEYIDTEPRSSRPSVPSLDLTRPSLASRFSFSELAQRPSVHFEGFDDVEVIPRILAKPLPVCCGTGTSGTSSSGGGSHKPGHRKSSPALTPEDELSDAHQVS